MIDSNLAYADSSGRKMDAKPPEIPRKIEWAQKEVAALAETVGVLVERLEPVLVPVPTTAETPAANLSGSGCPMAAEIEAIGHRARLARAEVEAVMEQLAL